jgi:Flp pilus assembly protein CpaB
MARVLTSAAASADANGHGLGTPPRRPLLSRVRGSLALAVVLAALAGLFYLAAAGSQSGVQVAVAAHDLRAGDALDSGSLRYVDAGGSKSFLAGFLRPEDLSSVRGSVLAHPVAAGTAIARADLISSAAGGQARTMSIPVDAEHAAGGAIRVGDVVDVIDGGENGAAPTYALTGAQVVAVARPSGSTLAAAGAQPSITVALPDALIDNGQAALRVAAAIDHGRVEVVRATGAAVLPPVTTPKPTTASSVPGR